MFEMIGILNLYGWIDNLLEIMLGKNEICGFCSF